MAAFSASPFSLTRTGLKVLLTLLGISVLVPRVSALNFVAGGPCESVCSDDVAGAVSEDVRCLDSEFNVTPASYLKTCVSCQLNSTAVDPVTKATDVEWGLCKHMLSPDGLEECLLTNASQSSLHLVQLHVWRSSTACIDLVTMSGHMCSFAESSHLRHRWFNQYYCLFIWPWLLYGWPIR